MRPDSVHVQAPCAPAPAWPLVSIVIPTFNRADYLAEAVDSVLAQDYPHVELIVIDDGSTDGTAGLLRRYAARCRCEQQANQGQSHAINRGWSLARGELLGYLGDDDLLCPGAIRTAVEALAGRPDAVMVHGDYVMIDAASRPFRRIALRPRPYLAMARDLRITPWDPSLTLTPDVDFYLRLGLRGPFLHLPRAQACLRVHAGSTNVRVRAEACDDEPLRVLARFFERSDLPSAVRREQRSMFAYACLMAMRGHLRARRLRAAARCLREAAHHRPRALSSRYALRLFLSGILDTSDWRRRASRLFGMRQDPRESSGSQP